MFGVMHAGLTGVNGSWCITHSEWVVSVSFAGAEESALETCIFSKYAGLTGVCTEYTVVPNTCLVSFLQGLRNALWRHAASASTLGSLECGLGGQWCPTSCALPTAAV